MERTKRINFQVMIAVLLLTAGCNYMRDANGNEEISNDVMKTAPNFSSHLDSLEWVFNNTDLPMKMRLIACDVLAFDLAYVDVNQAQSFALRGLELAEKTQNDSLIGPFYRNLGMAYDIKGMHDTAQIYFQKSLEYALANKDENLESFTYLALGLSHSNSSQYEISADYYEKALRLCEKKGYKRRYSTILSNIAITYLKMLNYERAEHYFLKAKEIFLEDPYPETLANIYLNMGILYYEQNRLKEAREASDESLKIFKSIGNTSGEALALMNQSRLFSVEKKYDRAMEVARQSLVLAEKSGYPYVIKNALSELSCLYSDVGNYKLSEEYALREMALLDSSEITEYWLLYKKLIPIYIKQGKKEDALNTFVKYDSIATVVNSVKVQNTYNELETKYETEKKELEIERQKNIIIRQNMQAWLLAGGVVVCLFILALLWYMLRLRDRRNRALTEKNETLAEMNATKNKFFSIISHDLKNPAIAQRDAIQLLVDNARLWDADTLSECYHELLKSAKGQVELLYNLLNWAQIQTGRMAYTPVTFNLATHLRSDIALIRKMAENKGITFTVQIPDDALVTGDSNMLTTVVRNLLTNAVKFTETGGKITLDISPCGTTGYTVTVRDTGIGMNTTDSREGTAGEQGSGLGLIVCKEMLEQHGSVLHLESEIGMGSCFWFRL